MKKDRTKKCNENSKLMKLETKIGLFQFISFLTPLKKTKLKKWI